MRDPLHWVSVKHKLALAFAALCLLAFGVGGFLISRSARQALEDEISARIDLQCRATTRVLDERLASLGQRTQDFASDGFIRERCSALTGAAPVDRAAVRAELGTHLRDRKLPLVREFVGLTVVAADGTVLAHVDDGRTGAPFDVPTGVPADAPLRHSDLLFAGPEDRAPLQSISTPLLSLEGTRAIGRLITWIEPEAWIGSALAELAPSTNSARVKRERVTLQISDRNGRTLEVTPRADGAAGAIDVLARAPARSSEGFFKHELAMTENGWTVLAWTRAIDAFAPVSGLQSRFLVVGTVLALLCAGLLFFPMRFLVRPLTELREAARRIRAGDYAVRVRADSNDEVGELARSFNHMAEAVEQQTGRLRRAADELRSRQRELAIQHARLDTVIRSLRDGLVVLDVDGNPVLANAAAEPLVRALHERSEALTAHDTCPADRARGSCATCLIQSGEDSPACRIDAGGRVFEVHGTSLPPDVRGRRGRVLVARDVTDRIEQETRDIHRERLSVLGEVAAVMAHELNNPLTSIRMFAQMLDDGLPQDSPYREHASVIVRNTETCRHSIADLLGYATDSAPEAALVSVHDVLDDVVSFVRPIADRARATLVSDLAADDDGVIGDEIQIRQLFVNLVMNAVQAAGGSDVTVTLATRNSAGALEVEVRDTGPGVPPELRDRVFDAFVSTKPRGEGTGLGLPTARRIAELHGGTVELVDDSRAGATFRVRLRSASAVSAGSLQA